MYGIPSYTSRVAKFNVATQNVTFIGDEYVGAYIWMGGVEGMDENIHLVPYRHDKWLKIDTVTETTYLVGDDLSTYGDCKYDGGVVGEDCNIYAIPCDANKVTTFNTIAQNVSEVGNRHDGDCKWTGGSLHSNGFIYYVPQENNKVLKIKTNHIRDEGNNLFESNASLTEFNKISRLISSNISMLRIKPSTIALFPKGIILQLRPQSWYWDEFHFCDLQKQSEEGEIKELTNGTMRERNYVKNIK